MRVTVSKFEKLSATKLQEKCDILHYTTANYALWRSHISLCRTETSTAGPFPQHFGDTR
jgi:hypothetical protein